MPNSLLKSKLYIPPVRPDLIHRPKLVELLNSGLACKLTLLSAPAGFGKTTLLNEWVAGCGRRVAWISLDKGDNRPERFLAYLIAAFQQIRPETGATLQTLLESPNFELSRQPVENLLASLVNDIEEIPCPFILVLDDYHILSEPSVHDVVTFIINNQPQQMHLVISSRTDPPWQLARMRSQCAVSELRVRELRFTPEEAGAFLNTVMKLNLLKEEVDILEERTEGWVAGLQLAALSLHGRSDIQDFIFAFAGSHHYISDFLIEEVLNQQPEDIREFLLKTSVLENLTPPQCDAVTGRTDSRNLLTRLEQANLFLISMDEEQHRYRYHHLFRDLLSNSLDSLYPGEAAVLHKRASQWHAAAGNYEEAVSHAFASKDIQAAVRLVEQAIGYLDIQNKLVTLTRWLEALPDELIQTRPWLCVYRAWSCQWMGKREEVDFWLRATENALKIQSDSSQESDLAEADKRHIVGHINAIRSHNALTHGDIPNVLVYSKISLELLPEGDEMRSETAVALGGAYWGMGDITAAEQAFMLARSNAIFGHHLFMAVPPTCYVGMMQTKRGCLYEAMATYRDALQLGSNQKGKETPAAGFANIKIGDLLREWDVLTGEENASKYLVKGVAQCQQLGQADVLTDGYVGLARLEIAQGNFKSAQETLKKAIQISERTNVDPFIQCWLDDCRLSLWFSTGNLDAAVKWAKASGLQPDGALNFHYDLNHINLARVLVAQGRQEPGKDYLALAQGLLQRLMVAAEKQGWIHEQIKILILQAFTHLANKENPAALSCIGQALHLAEPGGYIRMFLDEGSEIKILIEQSAKKLDKNKPVLAAYINKILNADNLSRQLSYNPQPAIGASENEAPVPGVGFQEPLTSRELDVLRLLGSNMNSTEIARVLFIAPSTVRTHIKSIYGKLMVNRRMDAIGRAHDLGLV